MTLKFVSKRILSEIDVVSLGIFDKLKQDLEMKSLGNVSRVFRSLFLKLTLYSIPQFSILFDHFQYAKSIWHTTNHNTGLLLARPQWNLIKDCLNVIYGFLFENFYIFLH